MEILKSHKTNQKSQSKIQKVQNVSTNHPVIFPERRQQHHSPSINLQDSPDKSREYHINGHHQQDGKQLQHHKNHTQIPQHSNEEQQLKEPQQKRRLERQMKKIYIGNLHENVTEKDLIELFGLETTQYLRNTCRINLITSKSTGKHRGFAFITTPDHVHDELLKLNGVEFKGRPIVVETAKTRSAHQNQATQNEANAELFYQSKKNIALFSDSIPRGIKFKELNQKINRGRIHLKAFPGARAQHLNHCLVPSLEEYEYDCAIIHVDINDILRDKNGNELKNLPEDILNIAN